MLAQAMVALEEGLREGRVRVEVQLTKVSLYVRFHEAGGVVALLPQFEGYVLLPQQTLHTCTLYGNYVRIPHPPDDVFDPHGVQQLRGSFLGREGVVFRLSRRFSPEPALQGPRLVCCQVWCRGANPRARDWLEEDVRQKIEARMKAFAMGRLRRGRQHSLVAQLPLDVLEMIAARVRIV